MEVTGGAGVADPGEIRPLKPCLVRRNHSREQHGVAASSVEELRNKACDILTIDKSLTPVTLVLAEDGTIVDDDDYFLCLPSNTKFVALASNEKWTYSNSDGGTAWISQESFDVDETDSGAGVKWKNVARQLKEDLSSIILLSEEELQVLTGVPSSDLAQELCQTHAAAQGLQNTLQRVLDQREEARQSRQLLELYLRALDKKDGVLSRPEESKAAFGEEVDAVDTGIDRESTSKIALRSQVLSALQEKPAPELSLCSQDLELVTKEDPQALASALNWDIKKTEAAQQACAQELARRLQQTQSLHSLRTLSARRNSLPRGSQGAKRAKQGPT
ncbi:DNA fragmentation factor subunit alpha [Heterocephalus glaber]|uniref:DNA fragmentation factor subunit alpha n=1 Tax=Heterocephalus glaber TaxID=10181 RepID=G5C528_HETGA|nr:DNA fragmentation factor subunit alpha [Heterocephalus glaber]